MVLQPIAAVLLGLWAGVMARSGWAVYHDGVRPLVAEWADGNLAGSDLAHMAADSNRPFVLGSAALSLVVGVPLAHWLWLPAEGLAFRRRQLWAAALVGGLWGFTAWLVIAGARYLAAGLPVPILPAMNSAAIMILSGLLFVPALASWHRWGVRAGAFALTLAALGGGVGAFWPALGTRVVSIVTMGSLLGTAAFFLWLARDLAVQGRSESGLPTRPRRAPLWALVVQGAVLAFAVRAGTFGWGSGDGIAAGQSLWLTGGVLVLTQILAFAPQWAAAQAGTGVGQLAGAGLPVLAGFLAPAPWLAPALGALAVVLQGPLSAFVLSRPAMSEAAESMRWATGKCAQAAILAAMVWAAASLLPAGAGVAVVIAVVVINDLVPNGIWKTAVPAWGLLLAGLLANLWHLLEGI